MHLRGGKKKKRTKKKSSSWPVFITEVMPCPTAPYLHAFTGSHILRAGAAVRWCDGGLGGTCCVQHGKFMPWWEMGAHGAAASCFPPSTHISVHLVKQGFVQCFLYVKKATLKECGSSFTCRGSAVRAREKPALSLFCRFICRFINFQSLAMASSPCLSLWGLTCEHSMGEDEQWADVWISCCTSLPSPSISTGRFFTINCQSVTPSMLRGWWCKSHSWCLPVCDLLRQEELLVGFLGCLWPRVSGIKILALISWCYTYCIQMLIFICAGKEGRKEVKS